MGQCTDISQIIRPSGIAGLDIIDSGPLPSNLAELLDSPRMKELLEQCKTHYDYVLIDGPAMLVSDAKSLPAAADGTLVVFKASATHRGAAMRIFPGTSIDSSQYRRDGSMGVRVSRALFPGNLSLLSGLSSASPSAQILKRDFFLCSTIWSPAEPALSVPTFADVLSKRKLLSGGQSPNRQKQSGRHPGFYRIHRGRHGRGKDSPANV